MLSGCPGETRSSPHEQGHPFPTPSSPGTWLRRRRRASKRRSSPPPRTQTGGRAGGARRPTFPAAAGEGPMPGTAAPMPGTANRTGWPTLLARHSTSDTVSGSAQCRSSKATTSPSAPGGASRSTFPLTACKSTPRPRRAAGPPATAPGSRTVRCGSHDASEGSPGSGRLRSNCSTASVTGRYGALAEAGTARPIPTGTCLPAAIRASSRIRRDLPMPGLTRGDDAAAPARQRSGKGRLQRLDLRPPPHQDRAQHLAHDPSLPHRRQGRSMITRPTPAGPFPSALSLIPALTAQNARIWTAVLMIGAEWASVQIGGAVRVAPDSGWLRSVAWSVPLYGAERADSGRS